MAYIRKSPYWRVRLSGSRHALLLPHALAVALEDLSARLLITTWSMSVYEPETRAFGGPEAMDAAHRFFHRDSVSILSRLDSTPIQPTTAAAQFPQRELSLLICAALLRAAGQDWHEQGDVWHRVAQMRPLDSATPHEQLLRTARQLRQLFAVDLARILTSQEPRPPFDTLGPWLTAATEAGNTLRDLARHGLLHRGLRDVLAHHIIFHWNRLGLPDKHQAILAHAATLGLLPQWAA